MNESTPRFGTDLTSRARQVVAEARVMLEDAGWDAVSMRPLAERLGMRGPSLYKHFANRDQIKSALISEGLLEIGEVLHAVLDGGGSVTDLLAAYRATGLGNPHLYRLTTAGPLDRESLPDGLEEWAGSPFHLVTGDETAAQALWSFAHGTLVLEIDGRYPPGTPIDRIWEIGAARFASSA